MRIENPRNGTRTEAVTLSTESIASASLPAVGVAEPCASCGVPLAADQRYCLECGERRVTMSSVLLGEPPTAGEPRGAGASPSAEPVPVPGARAGDGAERGARGNTVTVIAGVGVLLLAMGVGVLIGRSGASKPVAAPAQVISVSQPGAATGAATTPTETTPTKTPTTPSSKGGSSSTHGATKGASGTGSSPNHPAPPTVLKNLRKGGGQSYEQKSKNLPNVVSTG
jgi:hypothetical protein